MSGETLLTKNAKDGKTPLTVTQQRLEKNDGTEVTVICLACNNASTIKQTLTSIVEQTTNFRFKVYVGVDFGNDETAEIVKKFAESHSNVTAFFRESHIGEGRNLSKLIELTNSPYVAICRGNDYWVDTEKIQKQYNCLEDNKEISFCLTSAEIFPLSEIESENNDFKAYYNAIDDRYFIPESVPNYKKTNELSAKNIINSNSECISTFFCRWNYDIEFPEWYYRDDLNETALCLIQLLDGKAIYLDDVTTVCGFSEFQLRHSFIDPVEYYVYSKLKQINWLSGMLDFVRKKNITNYPNGLLLNKMKSESTAYINKMLVQHNDFDSVKRLFIECPIAGRYLLQYYIGADQDRRIFERTLNDSGYFTVVRRKKVRRFIGYYAKFAAFCLKIKRSKFITSIVDSIKNIVQFCCYWFYTPFQKKKNLWVISGFPKTSYMDNTKYFYEYVTKNHPEIDIYWLTMSKSVYKILKSQGNKVCLFRTKECRKILSHASVGIVDHYACADFDRFSGYNNGIKIVNLWHGVGFKPAGDENGPKWTNQRGLRRSTDILAQPSDNIFVKAFKCIKYFFHAYYRELFEKYLMFVCPGQERIDMVGKIWGIPESCYFMSGHPRNEPLYQTEKDKEHPLIMYAPTYRELPENEMKMIDNCLNAVPEIQKLMEKINGRFAIRLHPHTWRNYKGKILSAIRDYDRIFLDTEKDVYPYLAKYSVMISDYSSIALDFAMIDGPTIFLCSDLYESERGFNLDFQNVVPGPIYFNWSDTLKKVEEYVNDSQTDHNLRAEKCRFFFNPEVNDINNSERIVEEIKKRIKF